MTARPLVAGLVLALLVLASLGLGAARIGPDAAAGEGWADQIVTDAARRLAAALVDLHDFWLTTKGSELGITPDSGYAIVAVGGLGRREMLPFSDLDLVLLHDNKSGDELARVADGLWYPLWDANIRLDHSVRTVPEALRVAADRDCASVSAASVLAKVARDARMVELDAEAPEYGWASNKGYGAAVHRAAIDRIGVHEHHRRSWRLGSAPAAGRGARPAAAPVAGTVPTPGSAGVLWEGPWSPQDEEERR